MKKLIPILIISSPFLLGILGYVYMSIDVSEYSKYLLSSEIDNIEQNIKEDDVSQEQFTGLNELQDENIQEEEVDSTELEVIEEYKDEDNKGDQTNEIKEFLGIPIFDVVQIAPDGQIVVAGRTNPGDLVELLIDSNKVIDSTIADSRGEFVFVPNELLKAGGHELSLKAKSNNGAVIFSEETVLANIIKEKDLALKDSSDSGELELETSESINESPRPVREIPENINQESSVILLDDSGMASAVLQESEEETSETIALTLETLTFGEDESLGLSGRGTVGLRVNVYMDSNIIGNVAIENNGRWLLVSDLYVAPGKHLLRLDQHENDKVVSRLEIPFVKPEKIPDIEDSNTVLIQPGDTLWAIAKNRYGFGMRYTMIFTSNRDQIKNPDLIYPGQVFIIPSGEE